MMLLLWLFQRIFIQKVMKTCHHHQSQKNYFLVNGQCILREVIYYYHKLQRWDVLRLRNILKDKFKSLEEIDMESTIDMLKRKTLK